MRRPVGVRSEVSFARLASARSSKFSERQELISPNRGPQWLKLVALVSTTRRWPNRGCAGAQGIRTTFESPARFRAARMAPSRVERVTRLFAGGEPWRNGFAWKVRWCAGRSNGVRVSGSFSRCARGSIEDGAGDETRTRDINLGKVALYQLSYTRACEPRKIAARL